MLEKFYNLNTNSFLKKIVIIQVNIFFHAKNIKHFERVTKNIF
jgi:hypothetical protein